MSHVNIPATRATIGQPTATAVENGESVVIVAIAVSALNVAADVVLTFTDNDGNTILQLSSGTGNNGKGTEVMTIPFLADNGFVIPITGGASRCSVWDAEGVW
jgi:hypothetical protein